MTIRKWCFRMRPRRKITSLALALAGAVALLPCFAHPAFAADSAPEWLRAAAQQKLPVYDKDTVAVILLDETQVTVRDNGEIDTLRRGAIRLLRPEAHREYPGIAVDFDKDSKVSYLKAWTIESNGHEIALGDKDTVEVGYLSDHEYDDVKMKALQYAESNPGNVVGYEYVKRNRPYVFENNWSFQNTAPVVTARFELQLPPGWEFTASWFNYPEQKPQSLGANHYVWEVNNLPGVEIEPDMPTWRVIAGWAGIKYFPHDPSMQAKATGSWKDVGLWYEGLETPRRVATPAIKQKVAELTTGLTDPLAKARVLTDYVQHHIRYMAVEIGIGGWQPHAAGEVFARQFGDCKDKATLLLTMLHEAGIEAYSVSIDHRRQFVHPDFPSVFMDHAILAIRLPDNISDAGLYSVVNDPKLGRLLFFDPTNEYVPLGSLPWYLQETYALVITPEGGELISLPLLPPATNRLLRTATFNLSAAGDLSGEIHEMEWGGPAAQQREEFLGVQPSKRAEIFDHFLAGYLNSFNLTGATLGNLEQYDQNFVVDYKFVSPGYASSAGDLLFVRPRVVGDHNTGYLRLFTEQKPRKYPIQFEEATRQDDIFDITLPAGYVVDGLPKPVQADCAYATYKSETSVANGVMHYKRSFEIKDVMIPTEKLPAIRDFLQQVAADQGTSAVLRRATP
jgi:transglutaminase-like putative cysteine protease